VNFELFRIKVLGTEQTSLLWPAMTKAGLILEMISGRPSLELRKDHTWHIGNPVRLDDSGMYFRIGRITKTILERFDSVTGDFLEEPFEEAPYTHAFVDLDLEVAGIAAKSRLAPTAVGIANKLQEILQRSEPARLRRLDIEVEPIVDPDDFIQQLRDAYAITRFSVTFGRPNPFDVNQDFQGPLERFLNEASGETGRATISGKNLKSGPLEEIARSAAATGQDATASLRTSKGSKPVKKRLRRQPAAVAVEDLNGEVDKDQFVAEMRKAYSAIRTGQGERGK
jgi:hypothetical protein